MTIKDWLSRGIMLNDELTRLQVLKEQAYNTACGVSCGVNGDKVQTSKKNTTEQKVLSYVNYSQQVDDKISELIDCRGILLRTINRLNNPAHRIILIARYIEGNTWAEVSDKTNYSLRAVYKIHNQALEKLEEIISPPDTP